MDVELLDKICQQYNLGKLETAPVSLKGGFMHKMYSLFTDTGKYAIKLLNPFVMHRETASENFQNAEELELVLETIKLPIIPALLFNGSKMQKIDGQFFYLYQWFDGHALKNKEIEEIHCTKIGRLLAEIHDLDRKKGIYNRNEIHIDWDFYINQLLQKNKRLYNLLKENHSLLFESQRNGNIASKKLPSVLSICHNDMDSKNVLWLGSDCRIIDLECLSYSNPFMELYETALCWSGYEECGIDYNLLSLFIHSYAEAGGVLPTDWETIYNSNNGRLEWLEYNIKRALGMECSKEEIELGIFEVNSTMAHVLYYHSAKSDIINCLKNTNSNLTQERWLKYVN